MDRAYFFGSIICTVIIFLVSEVLHYSFRSPLIESETAKVVYKALYNGAPDYIKGLFHRLSDTQSTVLRNSNTDLRIHLLKTSSE